LRWVLALSVLAACAGFAAAQSTQQPPAELPQSPAPHRQDGQPPAAPSREQDAQPPAQSPSTAKIVANVNLVILPVTVKDGAGRLVPDLTRGDFRVFDDDVEQRIDNFIVEAFPLSVVVLIDNNLSLKEASQVQPTLQAIVGGLSANDEAFICRFDDNFHPGKGFTLNQDALLTQLKRTRIDAEPSGVPLAGGPLAAGPTINGQSPTGGPAIPESTRIIGAKSTTALDDAVYQAAELLKDRGRNRRKIILLIANGANAKNNTYTYGNVISELLRNNVSVFSVGVGGAFLNRKFSRLVDYAHDTGGDIYYAARSSTLSDLYSRITEEARNQYTLAYQPRGNDRVKSYHSVEVRVRRPGLTILTREGYYSAPATP
jgi:VWFA-related protein